MNSLDLKTISQTRLKIKFLKDGLIKNVKRAEYRVCKQTDIKRFGG